MAGVKVRITDATPIPPPPPGQGMGLSPRSFAKNPYGSLMYAKPFDLKVFPRNEWKSRWEDGMASKDNLITVRETGMYGSRIPARNQGQEPYCWAHSTVSAVLLLRALMNEPYADLSPFSVACPIKNFRSEGGWGAESLEWVAQHGIATSDDWPQQSKDRNLWSASVQEKMKPYIVTEWMDLDPNNMEEQFVTCLLLGIPVVSDFNWWSHSVCTMALKNPMDMITEILNSWGDTWSENGAGELEGRRAIPDAAIAPRVVRAAA